MKSDRFKSQERLIAKQTCGTSNTGWALCLIQLLFSPLKLGKVLYEDHRKSQLVLAGLGHLLLGPDGKPMLTDSSPFKMPTHQCNRNNDALTPRKSFATFAYETALSAVMQKHVFIPAWNHREFCTRDKVFVSHPSTEIGQMHLPCLPDRSRT